MRIILWIAVIFGAGGVILTIISVEDFLKAQRREKAWSDREYVIYQLLAIAALFASLFLLGNIDLLRG